MQGGQQSFQTVEQFQQPVMQGRPVLQGSGAREVAPILDAAPAPAGDQISPLDGATRGSRGPIVDPSAFILRGTKQVSHSN